MLEDDEQLRGVLSEVPGVDADAAIAALDSPEVTEVYTSDRESTPFRRGLGRRAPGQDRHQRRSGSLHGPVGRVQLQRHSLIAGGFQPVEAYDVLIANLDPDLHREPPPETPEPLLEYFEYGLTTQEVAALMTSGNDAPDRAAAEAALLELVADGSAVREPLGDDALWKASTVAAVTASGARRHAVTTA